MIEITQTSEWGTQTSPRKSRLIKDDDTELISDENTNSGQKPQLKM